MAFSYRFGAGAKAKLSAVFSWPHHSLKRGTRIATIGAAPTDDVDIASRVGDLCYDTVGGDLYIAASTDGSSTTNWVQIGGI